LIRKEFEESLNIEGQKVEKRMNKAHNWEVRDGNEKDMEGILSLRGVAFGEEEKDKLNPRFWRWEFIDGPAGKAFIYIVEDQNEIIGHFADIPRRFSVQGEAVLGTLSLDLMVHPDYWRKGIFEAMGRYGAEKVKQENGVFLTAFPIRLETILGLKKIGWKELAKLPVLVYPIRFRGILNRYVHFPPLGLLLGGIVRFFYFLLYGLKMRKEKGGIEIDQVGSLDELFDDFWQKASVLHPVIGIRNRDYLNWRYLQHPTRNYVIYRAKKRGEMRGYIVLRKVDLLKFNSAVIVDLLALDEETLSALVEEGIQHSQQEKADLLGFMVPQDHLYGKVLRRKGFLPSLKTFLFMIYPHPDKGIFLSPEKWYVNWGDTDVI
jgi:GNAT superfamily N-acetyltransferase